VNLSLVVAMSRTGLIGREGALPWRLSRDLRNFRRLTWGKPIIMGRKTHQALFRPLPGRTNIVLTRRLDYHAPGCATVHDRDQAITAAEATGSAEAMIIGGGQVYREFLTLEPTLHVTLVEGDFEGDVYFPVPLVRSPEWIVTYKELWPADADNPYEATYMIMKPTRSVGGSASALGPTVGGS
jgi:dihydrofolate reductase